MFLVQRTMPQEKCSWANDGGTLSTRMCLAHMMSHAVCKNVGTVSVGSFSEATSSIGAHSAPTGFYYKIYVQRLILRFWYKPCNSVRQIHPQCHEESNGTLTSSVRYPEPNWWVGPTGCQTRPDQPCSCPRIYYYIQL